MNEEEKDIFINSDISEDNDISKISKNKVNSNNNSFGGLISDNSMQKSSSIIDLNKENNNGPVQLPPISNKSILKKNINIVELKPYKDLNNNKSQQQKRTGLDEIKNRIMNGNNNKENNNRYKNILKNNSSSSINSNQNIKSAKITKK